MQKLFLLMIGTVGLVIAQEAFLYIEPETTYVQPEDSFNVNFNLTDVGNLHGYQIYLSWEPSILHIKRIEEGPFLGENGQKPTTFFTDYEDSINGHTLLFSVLNEQGASTSGSGTLAYGYFSLKQNGSSPLIYVTEGVWRTFLFAPGGNEIPFEKRDGYITTETGVTEDGKFLFSCNKLLFVSSLFRDKITLKFSKPLQNPLNIHLYDVSGRLVFERTLSVTSNALTLQDEKIKNLSLGIYLLSVSSGERKYSPIKLIKL